MTSAGTLRARRTDPPSRSRVGESVGRRTLAALKRFNQALVSRPGWVRIGSVVIFLACWQLGAALGWLDPRFYSSPSAIANAGVELLGSTDLTNHIRVTLTELMAGFLGGAVAAVLVGFVLGYVRWIGMLFDPIVMALYVTPRLAIYPILVIWFGLGLGSKIIMVFLGTFFMVLINVISGVRDVDSSLLRAARSFKATRWTILTKVIIPAAVPSVMTGLKQGWSQATIAVITAEMFVSLEGVGNLISTYGQALDTGTLLFLVTLVAGFAYVAIQLLTYIENRVTRWQER